MNQVGLRYLHQTVFSNSVPFSWQPLALVAANQQVKLMNVLKQL